MAVVVVIKLSVIGVISVIRNALVEAVFVRALIEPPPAERRGQVLGYAKWQAPFPGCALPHCADVFVRAHVYAVHGVHGGIIVEEIVVVGSLRGKKLRAAVDI